MAPRAGIVFQRKDGIWVARYHVGIRQEQITGEVKEDLIYEQHAIVDVINNVGASNSCMITSCLNTQNGQMDSTAGSEAEAKNHKTLGEWLSEWLDGYVRNKKGFSTVTSYETTINKHITPCMGHIALNRLTPRMFQVFFDEKAKYGRLDGKSGCMSPKSIENMRFILNAALCQAFDNGLIEENLVKQVKVKKSNKQEARALTPDEQARLIESCYDFENPAAFGIIFALHTGLQIGELLVLRWSDIDLQSRQVNVRQTLVRRKDAEESVLQFIELRKSRTVNMLNSNDDFINNLEVYRNKQKQFVNAEPELFIVNKSGGTFEPSNYLKLFKQMLKNTGIADANFDILRNTFAVRYLEQGFDLTELLDILGYVEGSVTTRKFIRLYDTKSFGIANE